MKDRTRTFTTTLEVDARARAVIALPFEPNEAWGPKPAHPVAGTVNGIPVRAVVRQTESGWVIALGPAWRRDCHLPAGVEVDVVLAPEGPQRDDLADDIADALGAEPDAAAFFDGLAQFYRRAHLRWIDATRGRPDVRAARIKEVVGLLNGGVKQRRKSP